LDLAGATALIIRRLILPLTVALVSVHAGQALAQPAPLSQAGAAGECRSGFVPLREEAEKRGKLIKAASGRHAPAGEACQLIENFGQAEIKMIRYVESHAASCGIAAQISDQLKAGHRNTETMQRKVCAAAQRSGPPGPTGDFWTLPEKLI
jgi:hypothetical protein